MQKEYNRTTENNPNPNPLPYPFLGRPHHIRCYGQHPHNSIIRKPERHHEFNNILSTTLVYLSIYFLTFCLYQDDHNSNVVVTTAIGNNPHAYLLTFRVALSLSLFTSCYVGPSLSLYSHPFTPLEMATTAIESDFLSLSIYTFSQMSISLSLPITILIDISIISHDRNANTVT